MGDDPSSPIILSLTLALVLVLLNGFFVAAEFAMVKARSSRIDALAQEGNVRAKFAVRILGNMNAYLSACQLGITLTSLGLGWLGEPTIAAIIEPYLSAWGFKEAHIHIIAFIIGFTIVTAFHITVGEQVPKTYAIRKSEAVTLWVALPLVVFFKLMYPFIWMLNGASNWMLRKSGIEPESEHDAVHTEEEIRLLVKESHKSGFIDNTELTLVDNVFQFKETVAREIMIPRTELVCLYADRSFEENMQIATTEMRTRYPVCDPDKDNIIGFIHIKDILKSRDGLDSIRPIVRPIMSIPESMPISSLLGMMQKNRTEFAILIDEYGGTSGLVTMEDILEELVGEIHDEFDQERPSVEQKDATTYSVDGLLHIEEFNAYFELDIPTADYDTIGGWMYVQVEMPPKKGQRVYYKEFELHIEEVDHMRISRLGVRRVVQEEAPAGDMVQSVS